MFCLLFVKKFQATIPLHRRVNRFHLQFLLNRKFSSNQRIAIAIGLLLDSYCAYARNAHIHVICVRAQFAYARNAHIRVIYIRAQCTYAREMHRNIFLLLFWWSSKMTCLLKSIIKMKDEASSSQQDEAIIKLCLMTFLLLQNFKVMKSA